VVPSHLSDTKLYDFAALKTQDTPFAGGDTAFDEECGTEAIREALRPARPAAVVPLASARS